MIRHCFRKQVSYDKTLFLKTYDKSLDDTVLENKCYDKTLFWETSVL